MIRTYSELISLPTFEERFEYCNLNGVVGEDTLGSFRFLCQEFYHSYLYLKFRDEMIDRDRACELAFPDFKIVGKVYLHHLNPLTREQLENFDKALTDPENVVCVSFRMHNAIHYGNFDSVKPPEFIERRPNDTCPWR